MSNMPPRTNGLRYPLQPVLLLCLLAAPVPGAQSADPELVAAVKSCLAATIQGQELHVTDLTVSGTGEAITIGGSVSVFSQEARLAGTFGPDRRLRALELTFAQGTTAKHLLDRIGGGGLTPLLKGLPLLDDVALRRLATVLAAGTGSVETITVGLGSDRTWDLLPGSSLRLGEIGVDLTISHPNDGRRTVRGSIAGLAAFGDGAKVTLAGTLSRDPADLELAARITNKPLTLQRIVGQLAGSEAAQVLDPMPAGLRDAALRDIALAVRPQARRGSLTADSSFGRTVLVVEGGRGPLQFIAALAPPAGFQFSRLDGALASLDGAGLDLSKVLLVVASRPGTLESGIDGLLPAGSPLDKGLNLLARLELGPLKLAQLLKTQTLDLRAHVPFPNPMDMALRAAVGVEIPLGENATFKDVTLALRPSPTRFKLALLGKIDLVADRQVLSMRGEMAIEPLTQTGSVTMSLDPNQGEWRDPFGLKRVSVEKLAASLGVTFGTGIPLPTIGLQGGLRLGDGGEPVRGNGVVLLNPRDPMNSMVALDLRSISLPRMIAIADAGAADRINRSPLGAALNSLELRNVNVRVVPNDIEFAGSRFERGFRFAGDFDLLGTTARGLFELDYGRGLSAMATLSAIRVAKVFELTGARGRPDPLAKLDLRTDRQEFLVNGRIVLLQDLFGPGKHFYSSEADLHVLPQGFTLYSRGKVLSVLDTEIECSANGSIRDRSVDFYLRAKMEQTVLSDLRERARNEIDKATRNHVSQINEAKAKVARAQAEVARWDRDIAAARKRVEARQARDIAAMRAKADADKRGAQAEYDRLGRVIGEKHAAIRAAKKWKFPKSIGAPAAIAALGTEIGWLETRRNAQKLIMDTIGSNLIKGLAKLGENFPKELSSELGPMLLSQKTAQGTLIAAQGVLDGYKLAVKGTMRVAKWIAENGLGNVIDLKLMQFETRLANQRDSYAQVAIRGRFCGGDFSSGMRLDLSSPGAMAGAIAKALLDGNVPNHRFADMRLQARPVSNLQPFQALPAFTADEILARAGSLKPVAASTAQQPAPLSKPGPGQESNPPLPAPPPAAPPNLSGEWLGPNRATIRITQQDERVIALMITPAGPLEWKRAAGILQGSVIPMMQFPRVTWPGGRLSGQVVRLSGQVVEEGRKIVWSNGTSWSKVR